MLHRALVFCAVVVSFVASPAAARDWFVRAGSSDGDGSLQQPFADPWQALDKVEAGDAVHVTAGKYYGRTSMGYWTIPFERVSLIGGYDKDFRSRDPWKNLTELLWDNKSKNSPKEARLASNAKNVVVDGIVIDMQDQSKWTDDQRSGRKETYVNEDAMSFTQAATIRNSVIINPANYAIRCPPGSTVENNLIVNGIGWAVDIYTNTGDFAKAVATIKNNTIVFSWTFKEPGKGAYQGTGIHLNGPANVTQNIIAWGDNHGLYQTIAPEKVSLTHNIFFMNLFSNVKSFVEHRDVIIDDKTMDILEELGLKASDGNEVKNPGLNVDKKWLDKVSKRTAGVEGKVEKSDWNELRKTLGLTLMGTGGEPASGVAPPMELSAALDLMEPKSAGKAGARKLKLEVKLQGGAAAAAAPQKSYEKVELASWANDASKIDGKAIEMTVAIGGTANIGGAPAQYNKSEHAGTYLYPTDGQGTRVTALYKKGTGPQRVAEDLANQFQGSGTPDRLFTVRGIAHVATGYPKTIFFMENIEPAGAGGVGEKKDRPAGRDWFVREGAKGGDGSKDKPFKDPFQALEKVEAGDTIHVTEGEYVGKLRAGYWKIDTQYITMLGGYDKDFKSRNPWKNPSLLYSPADFKGMRAQYTIEGDDDHTGAVVDGFVFDRKTSNKYTPEGDLDYSNSQKAQHIWLARPECEIRNNIFVNGPEGAIRLGSAGQVVENNIFLNHVYWAVRAEKGHGNDVFIFRNNTVAFAWDPIRFGQGGSSGHLLKLESYVRAIVDNNIFQFADNDAVQIASQAKDVELTNNTFSHNLWSAVKRNVDSIIIDDKNWAQLSDLGFGKLQGNQLVSAGLPLDQQWFDVYLGRTAYTPGKVQMDDWNQLREVLGQPLIATGGKAGSGFAPLYDWKKALTLFPKNPKVKAGARMRDLPVTFSGVARQDDSDGKEYAEVGWDVAMNKDSWEAMKGQRVTLKVVIRSEDNQYMLDDIKKGQYTCFTVTGPEGNDSGGLPLRVYVKKGSKHDRVVKKAKSYSSGQPEQTYTLKGVARENRQLIAEVVERAD